MKQRHLIWILIAVALIGGYAGHAWEKSRKLDDYFIEQFALDWLTQVTRNEKGHHGEIFEKAEAQMKEQGYNPSEIKEIMVKGFDRGNAILAQQQKSSPDKVTS